MTQGEQPLLGKGAMVLFQGDSITDAGRDRGDPSAMGQGYAMMAAGWFSTLYPERDVKFFNRGIGGNRIIDLQGRWLADCLALHPTWVSIMIGINECWRRYDAGDPTAVEAYEAGYRDILGQVKTRLGAKLILLEPFVLPVPEDRKRWREDLDPKIAAVHRLAAEFDAVLVPLDRLFVQACQKQPPSYWAQDGVHPTLAGHALISQAWLRAVRAMP